MLGQKAGAARVRPGGQIDPVRARAGAMAEAHNLGFDVVIVDTAGRLHIDDELMTELQAIKAAVEPSDLLYVADAMTGQDAIKSAGEFNRRDRRHRRGAHASSTATRAAARRSRSSRSSACRSRSSAAASGSRTSSRSTPTAWCRGCSAWATCCRSSRRPSRRSTRTRRERLEEKIRHDDFTLEDFRDQLRTIRKMGPLESILGMIPGMGNLKQLAENKPDEKQLSRIEAIINSMTPAERADYRLINGSRRKRIARGSGTSVEEINRLLKQFQQMRKMLKGARRDGGRRQGRDEAAPADGAVLRVWIGSGSGQTGRYRKGARC